MQVVRSIDHDSTKFSLPSYQARLVSDNTLNLKLIAKNFGNQLTRVRTDACVLGVLGSFALTKG